MINLIFFNYANAKTANDKSSQITIDGITSDFDVESDQILLSPDLSGMYFESDNDSKWGSGNDISKIKLTWDSRYLYIGIDGACSGNNIICYIDTEPNKGISDVSTLPAWRRKFTFENISPDFFLATWDNNESPQFWKIIDENNDEDKTSFITAHATFHSTIQAGMEAKIPWNVLYGLGDYKVATNAILKIVAVVAGGEECGGPDSAPDSSESMPVNCDETPVIDNFLIIPVDSNSDGFPDIDVNIRERTDVKINVLALKYQPLKAENITVENKSFSPNNDNINDYVIIKYILSKDAKSTVKVFTLDGKCVSTIQDNMSLTAGIQTIKWNGYDNAGKKQEAGLYIIVISLRSAGISYVKKIPVFLIE